MSDWMQHVDIQAVTAGLLVGRPMVALGVAAHGSQKPFGWFGGHGLAPCSP